MSIPIFFIHKGNPFYLQYSLAQARYTHPDSTIYLIGDETNNKFPFVTHLKYIDYFKEASEIAKVYVHTSDNLFEYDLFCFQRWMVLADVVKELGINDCIYIDSDVLLYSNLNFLATDYSDKKMAYCFGGSPHVTYFSLERSVQDFADYLSYMLHNIHLLANYKDLFKGCNELFHTNLPPISGDAVPAFEDMTILQCYFVDNLNDIQNLYLVDKRNSTFDSNFNCAHGYQLAANGKHKEIKWINKQPYCYNTDFKKWVLFNGIHFQGGAKRMMPLNTTYPKTIVELGKSYLTVAAFFLKDMLKGRR